MITNTGTLASWLTAMQPSRSLWLALAAGLMTLGAHDAHAVKTNTTTQLAASPATADTGVVVTLTATVSPSNASGTVTFKDGTTTLGTAPLASGVATFSTSFSSVGTHSLTAVYGGTSPGNGFNPSTSAATTVTVIDRTVTTTNFSMNPATPAVGQSVLVNVTVSGNYPTGTVTLSATGQSTPGSIVATGTLSSGTATISTSFPTSDDYWILVSYGGDAANRTSHTSPRSIFVNTSTASSTTVSANPNPAAVGQNVTLTASVSPTSATGSVTFQDGTTTLGTGTLSGGVASLSTSALAQGSHNLTASYAGDASTTPSTSSALNVQILDPVTPPSPPISPVPVANYEYDAQGNPTKVVRAPGVSGFGFTTQASYDKLNRAQNTTDAKSGITQFGYDGLDRTVQVIDPRNLVTQYPRNGLGDATSVISPDTGTASHTYDAAGNLFTRTDSRGVLATYSYDPLNRLAGITYTQSGQTTLAYSWVYDQTGAGFSNGIGRLTSTSHPNGLTQYSYDPQGRLLSELQRVNAATGANSTQISSIVSYGNDGAGHVTSITYPSGRVLSISYTGGQPTALSLAKDSASTPTTLIDQIQFAPFGGLVSWNWQMASGPQANGRIYDTSGRLVRYALGGFVRDITYDAADRITSYTHYDALLGATAAANALNQSFGYDELGRLTSITTATASWSIGYDANGNRTSVTLNGTPSSYTTSTTSNRLNAIDNPARSFGYDNAGNTTSDSGGYTSTYNLAGRLTTLTKAGTTSTYTYDGMDRRVRKVASSGASSTVLFVYDQNGQLLGEYDQNGTALREYVWLGSTPVAMFTPDPTPSNPPLVYFIHTDHIDTPRVIVDKNNNIRWRWMAEPFGTTAPETNPVSLGSFTQNLRFPGQYADQESGLFYNYFRYYDSSTGRFPQFDPIGLAGGSMSGYAYGDGDPIHNIDPLGLQVTGTTQPSPNFSPFRLPASVEVHNREMGPDNQLRREFKWPDPYGTIEGVVNNRPWCRVVCDPALSCMAPRGYSLGDGCYEVCSDGPFASAPAESNSSWPPALPSVGGTRPMSSGDARYLSSEVGGVKDLLRRLLRK